MHPDVALRDDLRRQFLDLGERVALALAAARQPAVLLIDELAGTVIARVQGFTVIGTLGVLFSVEEEMHFLKEGAHPALLPTLRHGSRRRRSFG